MLNYRLIIVLFSSFVTNYSILVSAQYYIKERNVPSYLHHKFQDIIDDIFPNEIRISLSLSRVSGTLLYSIDNRMNQLIISLIDTLTLHIEFSKQQVYVSLTDLCGCQRCRYEEMDLRIQMRYFLYLQCNDRPAKKIKYDVTTQLNDDYPIPFKKNQNLTKTYDAHLWLVNTPQYEGLYPNNDQLSGCIFKVSYNGKPLMFTDITDNIGRKCIKRCTRDICNGGQCNETYSDPPLCNCTTTLLNGRFCNDSMSTLNIQTITPDFQFDVFKISWNSSTERILELNNTYIHIRLSRNNSSLVLEYNYSRRLSLLTQNILSEKYLPNVDSILIVQFHEHRFDIHYYNNDEWHQTLIPTNVNLKREIFHSITLLSGTGKIDMVFKTSHSDYIWRRISVHHVKETFEASVWVVDNPIGDDTLKLSYTKLNFSPQNCVEAKTTINGTMSLTIIIIITIISTIFLTIFLLFCLSESLCGIIELMHIKIQMRHSKRSKSSSCDIHRSTVDD